MADAEDGLAARLSQGDAEALAELLRVKERPLLAFIERSMGPALRKKVEAADILQETSLAAMRELSGADFSSREPFSWLCRLAEQRIIDAHRRHVAALKRSSERETSFNAPAGFGEGELVDLLVVTMTTPSAAFSRNERALRLAEATASLPEESQTVLRLRFADGMATKDIARQIGKTDGAVRVLLSRTLAKLAEILGPPSETSQKKSP